MTKGSTPVGVLPFHAAWNVETVRSDRVGSGFPGADANNTFQT